MNVLHVSPSYYPASYWGGPIFSVYAMNNALARLPGIEMAVLTTDAAGPKASDRLAPADGNNYPGQRITIARRIAGSSVAPGLLLRLPRLIRWADVVHLTATYSFPTIPTLLLCRAFCKPVVWSPRGAIQDNVDWSGSRRVVAKRAWEWVCDRLLEPALAVLHTTSEQERRASAGRITRASTVVIPNGVELPSQPAARAWCPGGELRLLYLGRLSPKKGIENLLQAAKRMEGNIDFSLRLYGTGEVGYTQQLKALCERMTFRPGTVQFLGHVTGNEKDAAFAQADLCIVPSYSENFCMVVAEALARGVPVVASRGTPWSAVETHGCGLWVDNTPEALCRAIATIRGMPLAEMGAKGRKWMQRDFSWDAIGLEHFRVYERLVRSGRSPAEQY